MAESSIPLSAVVVALGWTLLHFLWQGALIGVAYALARRAMAAAAAAPRLLLGHVALLACAAAPVITFALHWPAGAGAPVGGAASIVAGTLAAPPDVPASVAPEVFLPWLVAAWAAGVLLLAARTALQWWTLRMLARAARPLGDDWTHRLAALKQRMGVRAAVALRESSRLAAPLLVGWLRPTILLPIGLALRLPPAHLEAVLAHELAHVRRFDAWINALQCALETLLFYHPAVHWIGGRVRADREECCDLAVTASGIDRLDYARALLALGESHRERAAHGRLAIAATDGVLLARVERLLLSAPRREAAPPANWPVLGLAAILCALVISAFSPDDEHRWAPVTDALWSSPSPARVVPLAELVVGDLAVAPDPLRPSLPTVEDASPAEPFSGASPAADSIAPPTPAVDAEPATRVAPVAPASPPVAVVEAARPRLEEVLVEPLRPLQQVAPVYPRAALARGLEGSVVVSFSIDAAGRPVDVEVESSDGRAFDAAALAALARWRFAASDAGSRQRQTFDFRLDGLAAEADERDACNAPTGSRICRRGR